MSYFKCPECEQTVFDDDIPDRIANGSEDGRFEYECHCGAVFSVHIDWRAVLTVERGSVRKQP